MKSFNIIGEKKVLISFVFCFLWLVLLFGSIFASELNLQVAIEKWDKAIALKDGYYEATLVKKKNIIQKKQTRLKIWKQKYNLYIVGFNEEGEEQWKLFYNSKTNRSYFTKIPSQKIILISSYSEVETVPEVDFSFADLLFYKIEERFFPKNFSDYQAKATAYHKIELSPLQDLQYQKIFIYLSKENLTPHRMDVFNINGEFYKIMRVYYNDEQNNNLNFKKISLINTNTGEESILEFINYKFLKISETFFELSNFTQRHLEVFP